MTGVRSFDVHLVEDHHRRRLLRGEVAQQTLFELAPDACLGHQYGDLGPLQRLRGLFHAQCAQTALFVNASRIDEQHRTQWKQFHGLFDRIGGGACNLGDNGNVLPRDGIQQARFANVAATEETDVQA